MLALSHRKEGPHALAQMELVRAPEGETVMMEFVILATGILFFCILPTATHALLSPEMNGMSLDAFINEYHSTS